MVVVRCAHNAAVDAAAAAELAAKVHVLQLRLRRFENARRQSRRSRRLPLATSAAVSVDSGRFRRSFDVDAVGAGTAQATESDGSGDERPDSQAAVIIQLIIQLIFGTENVQLQVDCGGLCIHTFAWAKRSVFSRSLVRSAARRRSLEMRSGLSTFRCSFNSSRFSLLRRSPLLPTALALSLPPIEVLRSVIFVHFCSLPVRRFNVFDFASVRCLRSPLPPPLVRSAECGGVMRGARGTAGNINEQIPPPSAACTFYLRCQPKFLLGRELSVCECAARRMHADENDSRINYVRRKWFFGFRRAEPMSMGEECARERARKTIEALKSNLTKCRSHRTLCIVQT